jgi:hypothetical protein
MRRSKVGSYMADVDTKAPAGVATGYTRPLLMARGDSVPGRLMLRGRRDECAVLDGLLEDAHAGQSGVLVLRGDAGIGKTALLDYAIESASDMLVVRASGVESEVELAFAALHQLCAPLLHRLERLPAPQRQALEVMFGLSDGPARTGSSLAWRCSGCCRGSPRSAQSCA